MAIHELRRRQGRLTSRRLGEPFQAKSASDAGDRLIVGAAWWAFLDGPDVVVNGRRHPLPAWSRSGAADQRQLTFLNNDVVAVCETRWDSRRGWRLKSHQLRVMGGTVQRSVEGALTDSNLVVAPGVHAIVGPASGGGTLLTIGKTSWRLADDGSLGETWFGWTGLEYALIYASHDQATLYYRGLRCPDHRPR